MLMVCVCMYVCVYVYVCVCVRKTGMLNSELEQNHSPGFGIPGV